MLFDVSFAYFPAFRKTGRIESTIDWAGSFAVMTRARCIRQCIPHSILHIYIVLLHLFALSGPAHPFRKDRNDIFRVGVY